MKNDQQAREAVRIMTVHGAKGLEFPQVFLAGVEDNIFPSYMSLEEGENGLEEERRLFYVGTLYHKTVGRSRNLQTYS